MKKCLNDYTLTSLETMVEQDYYDIDILMWTQIIYQLLYTYQNGTDKVKKDVVETLKPLYFARSVTFDYVTWRYDPRYVEAALISQAKAFASQKPYFMGLYLHKGPKR